MHFELSNKKTSFLKTRKFFNIITIGFAAVMIIGSIVDNMQGDLKFDIFMGAIWISSFIVASFIYLIKQKSISIFDVDDYGINANNIKYSWSDFKKYHLYGESQSERVGSTNYISVGNPYKHNPTQIFKIKKRGKFINSWLNLEVDKERVEEFSKILSGKNIPHTSKWRLIFGA